VIGTGKVVDDTTPVIAPININMGMLMIGANYMSAAYRTATGTLEYQLEAGSAYEVSPININPTSASIAGSNGGSYIDIDGAGTGTANLVVKSAGAAADVILLVNNLGSAAVKGSFDNLTGDDGFVRSGAQGTGVWVGGRWYYLTYMYDSVSGTDGWLRNGTYNDIALVPEPATLALLGLGLLVIRRKK
jgi:hypothetical protein